MNSSSKLKIEFYIVYKYIVGKKTGDTRSAEYYQDYILCENNLVNVSDNEFSSFLSKIAFHNIFNFICVDVWTKLFYRGSLIRHKINCVIALIETTKGVHWRLVNSRSSIIVNYLSITLLLIKYVVIFIFSISYVFILYLYWRLSQIKDII